MMKFFRLLLKVDQSLDKNLTQIGVWMSKTSWTVLGHRHLVRQLSKGEKKVSQIINQLNHPSILIIWTTMSTGVQSIAAEEDSKSSLLASNNKFMNAVWQKNWRTKEDKNAPEWWATGVRRKENKVRRVSKVFVKRSLKASWLLHKKVAGSTTALNTFH